jgi:hypothetical protein
LLIASAAASTSPSVGSESGNHLWTNALAAGTASRTRRKRRVIPSSVIAESMRARVPSSAGRDTRYRLATAATPAAAPAVTSLAVPATTPLHAATPEPGSRARSRCSASWNGVPGVAT